MYMNGSNIDIGIITIIPTEIQALLSIFDVDNNFETQERGNSSYLRTEIYSEKSKRNISVVISFVKRQGNVESAITTTRFLQDWYPRLMCLVGISAGIKDTVKIGDIILPETIHDYTIKKYSEGVYIPRSKSYLSTDYINNVLKINPITNNHFAELCQDELSKELLNSQKVAEKKQFTKREFDGELQIKDGSLISDNTLIRDPSFFSGITDRADEKCRGADMESAGFVRACLIERSDFPWLVIRGVSDFGDESKCDDFQLLAAKSACIALREILVNCINVNSLKENPRGKEAEESLQFDIIKQINEAHNEGNWKEVCQIGPIISRYLWLSGQYALRIEIGKKVYDAATRIGDDDLRTSYLIDDIGWTVFVNGNTRLAQTHIKDGLRIAKEKENYYLCAKAHRHLASIHRRSGEIEDATKQLNNAWETVKKISDSKEKFEMQAALLFSQAKLCAQTTDDDKMVTKCIGYAYKSAEQFQQIGDKDRAVKVYAFIGDIYIQCDQLQDAINAYTMGMNMAYDARRYDEIKANTLALLNIPKISLNDKIKYARRICEYCEKQRLVSESDYWKGVMKGLNDEK